MKSSPDAADRGQIVDVGIGIVLQPIPNKMLSSPAGGVNPETPSAPPYNILITRRPNHTVFGGYWELPGGKVDPHESVETCVTRELLEEVGVEIELVHQLSDVVFTYPHATVRLHPWVCRLTKSSPEPRALHVSDWRWCALSDLNQYDFPPANDSIIDELVIYVRSLAEHS